MLMLKTDLYSAIKSKDSEALGHVWAWEIQKAFPEHMKATWWDIFTAYYRFLCVVSSAISLKCSLTAFWISPFPMEEVDSRRWTWYRRSWKPLAPRKRETSLWTVRRTSHSHVRDAFLANVNSTFTFAICRRPSVCGLSSVCNVRAPYSGDWNFRQCYAIWYAGHLLTSR